MKLISEQDGDVQYLEFETLEEASEAFEESSLLLQECWEKLSDSDIFDKLRDRIDNFLNNHGYPEKKPCGCKTKEEIIPFLTTSEKCNYEKHSAYKIWRNIFDFIEEV